MGQEVKKRQIEKNCSKMWIYGVFFSPFFPDFGLFFASSRTQSTGPAGALLIIVNRWTWGTICENSWVEFMAHGISYFWRYLNFSNPLSLRVHIKKWVKNAIFSFLDAQKVRGPTGHFQLLDSHEFSWWGAPIYDKKAVFTLQHMEPHSFRAIQILPTPMSLRVFLKKWVKKLNF